MSFEMKQLLVDRSSSILFFLCETVIFLATYIITPLTIVLSLLLSNALFWAVRRLCPNLLPRARLLVAYHWKFLSRVWHGHEIIGSELLPATGPALLLFYHGALPVDYYFLVADTLLSKGRIIQIFVAGLYSRWLTSSYFLCQAFVPSSGLGSVKWAAKSPWSPSSSKVTWWVCLLEAPTRPRWGTTCTS